MSLLARLVPALPLALSWFDLFLSLALSLFDLFLSLLHGPRRHAEPWTNDAQEMVSADEVDLEGIPAASSKPGGGWLPWLATAGRSRESRRMLPYQAGMEAGHGSWWSSSCLWFGHRRTHVAPFLCRHGRSIVVAVVILATSHVETVWGLCCHILRLSWPILGLCFPYLGPM